MVVSKRHSFVVVMILILLSVFIIFLIPSPGYTQDSVPAPISSALHVLPPIGEDTGDVNNFDTTLTKHIKVLVWQLIGEEDYVQVAEFTSQRGPKGHGYIKLEDDQYHVNWKIKKADTGKDYVIHFTVADLNVGYVTHSPRRGRTLPIKFRIDNHPSIRARVLNEQGFSALEISLVLVDEFQLGSSAVAQILSDEAFDVIEIGEVLRDVFETGPEEAAQTLSSAGFFSATDVGRVLLDVFDLGADPHLKASSTLKDAGYSMANIQDFLEATGAPASLMARILRQIGFNISELLALLSRSLAEEFAPQLRFDKEASEFPMSAQDYFEESIEADGGRLENNDVGTLTTPGEEPPTYFKAIQVGSQIRILYWWYYGYQSGCWTPFGADGIHDGDWERVMVTLSEDNSEVAAVTFWQHSGWYTRLADGADSDRFDILDPSYGPGIEFYAEKHPVVYVGRTQHGSYHNQGGIWDDDSGLSWCTYFDDARINYEIDFPVVHWYTELWLDTQNNLVSLADYEEQWMLEEKTQIDEQIGLGDGTTMTFDLDSKNVIASSVQIKVNGDVSDRDTWTFSNDTGTKGEEGEEQIVDQITFNDAPDSGAIITASWEKEDFNWAPGGDLEKGIGTHPIEKSTEDNIMALKSCRGFGTENINDFPRIKITRGCFESQCKNHNNQEGYTLLHPGTCTHCPSGYTDMGTFCAKGGWPWEWRVKGIEYYGLEYTLPNSDLGLTKKKS